MWVLAFLSACVEPAKDSTDTIPRDSSEPGDADTDVDADTDSDSDVDTESPVITSAEAYCYFHETGEQFYNWYTHCVATDPQDTDTLDGGELVISREGATIAEKRLACDRDTGDCATSFREDQKGVICADASDYRFTFVVVDEDGNRSESVEVIGTMQ